MQAIVSTSKICLTMTFIFVSLELNISKIIISLRFSVNANKKSGSEENILKQAIKNMNDLLAAVVGSYMYCIIQIK